ncbi:hypothetical protein [Oceanithermus sp.]
MWPLSGATPGLRSVAFVPRGASGQRAAFERGSGTDRLLVVVNAEEAPWRPELPASEGERWRALEGEGRLEVRDGLLVGAEVPPLTLQIWAPAP